MKFDKDIFISYAHLDDTPLDEGAKGWITDFHTLLETRLEQTIGHEILIWRDAKLSGNEVFAPEIESQLPRLKIMVSIITPRYLISDWCKREMGAFYKAAVANGGLSVGNKSRIFKIVKTPVDKDVIEKLPDDIHRVFDEILDYKFYLQEPATGKFRELSRSSWVDNSIKQEYMNKLDDVVQDMANLIKQLNNADEDTPERRKIYLAETSYDLQIYRDNLVRELDEAGFTVLPDRNLPFVVDKFTTEVSGFIDQSMLSLHMISSTNYAAQPEGVDKSIVILQNEIAAKKSEAKGLRRLIWIPPAAASVVISEALIARQTAFVTELKSNPEYQKGADILVGPLEEFKLAIFDTIRRMEAEEEAKKVVVTTSVGSQVTADDSSSVKLVYLICNQQDLDNTRDVEDLLTDNGFEILLPLFDGDSAQLRQAHLDNLKICDAVLIYYGTGNYRWVGSMKSDLMRIPALGREKPLMEKMIYIAGPGDADKGKFKSNDIDIANGVEGFKPELFSQFIQGLK
jgi:hypothetical protein